MSAFSPLLIISFNTDDVADLIAIANGLGYTEAHIVVGTVAEAINQINSRSIPPTYIIIDIGERSSDVFADLDEIALHCDPKVKVVVIGSVNDIGFYRELRSRGVVEYCAKPVKISEIRDALFQSTNEKIANTAEPQKGTVISCISAASGDGASTVAVNLAYCLAEEFNKTTVLIDMDYQFGLIAKSLDITAPFGIRELFDYPERGIDELLVEKMQVKYGRNLRIVASPHELLKLPDIKADLIRDFISLLSKKFDFVIIDVPHVWTQWTAATLVNSDHVILVGQLWLRSLTHSSRLLSAWQSIGLANNSISLVINRSGAKFKEAITIQDFERITHNKIEAFFSNDIKAVVKAETHGKTIFEIEQNTLLKQEILTFTQLIMKKADAAYKPITMNEPSAGRKGLLSFLGKKDT